TVTASGGTTPYTYIWNTGVSTDDLPGVSYGIYTVTVTDANLCTTAVSATITQPAAALSASITAQTNVDCFGASTGSATVTASGGTTPYTYDWSPNGFTGDGTITYSALTAGTYNVTVTDANLCTITTSATITQPIAVLSITVDSTQNVSCFGGTDGAIYTTTAGGTVPYSYSWNIGCTDVACNVSTGIYTVTVTDANLCTTVASATITEPDPVFANAGSDTAICFNDSVMLNASGGINYLWSTGESSSNIFVQPFTNSDYIVTVSDAVGCTGIDSVSIFVNSLPTANAGTDVAFCYGGSATLSATGGVSYLWSTGEFTQSIFVSPALPVTYYVTVTDINGCTDVDDVFVNVNSLPAANAGPDVEICQGDTIALTASGATFYLWSNSMTTATISVIPSATTLYTVTVTDVNSCSDTDSTIVTVNPLPIAVIGTDTAICYGDTISLAASGGADYLWSTSETGSIISVNPWSNTTYFVTVTDSKGCADTAKVSVTVNSLPVPVISGSFSYCSGDSTLLSTGSFINYLWSTGNTLQNIYADSSDNPVSVTVTDMNGCSGISSEINLTEGDSLSPVISGNLNYCEGNTVTLNAGLFDNYLWSTGDTIQSINVTESDNPVSVTVTDISGCSGQASQVFVIEHFNPVPSISGGLNYCEGNRTTLDAGIYADDFWSTSDTTQIINATIADNPISVTITDINGCTGNAGPVNVAENANPVISIPDSIDYCQGDFVTLDAGAGFSSYQWSNTATTQIINATSADNPVSVTITDANGCTDSEDAIILIEHTNPSPIISGSSSYCTGDSSLLNTQVFTDYLWSTGDTIQQIYATITDNPVFVTVTNIYGCTATAGPLNLLEGTSLSPAISGDTNYCQGLFSVLDAGIINANYLWSTGDTAQTIVATIADNPVIVTVSDAFGCSGTDTIILAENPNPVPDITGNLSYCENSSTLLNVDSFSEYLWSTGATTQTIYSTIADNPVYITVTNIYGCTGVDSVILSENSLPTAYAGTDITICYGDSATLTGTGGLDYLWSTSDSTAIITINPVLTTIYYLTVTDAFGCTDDDEMVVNVKPVYSYNESTTICNGETYTWHSNNYTTAGIYFDSLQTISGCDSIFELTLIVNPVYTTNESAVICVGESYFWHGNNYTLTGTYYDSLLTVTGCDSIFELALNVNPTYSFTESQTICQGATFTWHTNNYSVAGVYYDNLTTIAGCDSIFELTLNVAPVYSYNESATICDGGVYNWHGNNYSVAGVYYDNLTTVAGC
ncbi:MAG: SprB repeat-containing protein, partial [Bacteroidia bacterium]|nr:SprB repeat-containing protein [Bacteroidia bacterium]